MSKPRPSAHPLYWTANFLFRALFTAFGSWKVSGSSQVPSDGPLIVISNHASYLDPPIVGTASPRPVAFMARSDLFTRSKLFGSAIRTVHAYPVRLGMVDRDALRTSYSLLDKGWAIGVFPEGHRSEDGNLQEFQPGLALIALQSRAPVLPMGIAGAFEMLPPRSSRPKRGHIEVVFGAPLDLADVYDSGNRKLAAAEITRRSREAVAGLVSEARAAREKWLAARAAGRAHSTD